MNAHRLTPLARPLCARRRHGAQRGVVIVMLALALAVLVGFLGLVVDLGRLFVTKTELQSAMDACALAAARELRPGVAPPDTEAINRAVSAGLTAGTRNRVGFQAAAVTLTASDIWFSDRLSNNTTTFPFGYVASGSASAATARYAMCARSDSGIATFFIQVLQAALGSTTTSATVSAFATATQKPAQSNCAIPLGMCKLPAGSAADPFAGMAIGQWMTSRLSASATGSFDWIDFTPPGGGADELADQIRGTGACSLPPTGSSCTSNPAPAGCVGEQGNKNSLGRAWNTRFGLYKGSYNINNSTPDFTGYAYTATNWPEQFNAYGGSSSSGALNYQNAKAAFSAYQGDGAVGIGSPGTNSYSVTPSTTLQTAGADRRLVTVPVVDCTSWAASTPQTVPILGYACALMLHPMSQDNGPSGGEEVWLEFLGASNLVNSPCSTYGLAGGTIGPLVPALVH